MHQIEDKILQMLADSSGDILDDEELINNLAASKTTSEAIGGRMRDAETTSKEINETRELYRPVVRAFARCSISRAKLLCVWYHHPPPPTRTTTLTHT
jgi:hypothetical protein